MEQLKRCPGSTFDSLSRRKWVEDQDTILELTGKTQELQNEINGMNVSRDFQDAESVRSGHSHVASQPVSFPPHPVPGGMLSRSIGMPSRKDGRAAQHLGHAEQIHSSQAGKSENQTPVEDQRCQSGPSAKKFCPP